MPVSQHLLSGNTSSEIHNQGKHEIDDQYKHEANTLQLKCHDYITLY